ncbi:MAG: helix-turn-helix domain-containing protein [Actinobacteria bacterium]|nr:helix-turn-helix domain-containing protein [Actinomycetota bacterium]
MDARHFESTLGDLTAILGDATRRGIYLAVAEADVPATVSVIAERFGIHPNVARHHLERLTAEGYLEETGAPEGAVHGAGRPPRHYRATTREIAVSYPPRRFDLLAELLVQVVEGLDDGRGPAVAEEVGYRFGAALAEELGLSAGDAGSALEAVSGALETIGFGVAAAPADASLLTSHCPFGATATDHPEIVCRIDQGLVRGLMDAARGTSGPVVVTPHQHPGDACVAEV